mmetsp:Transcript_4617/g.10787  ORF Transcript_4617/g.10787 Transcript_4617/m.10787 type:complete len:213 (+) Transcript_4617:1240-1878(+)
MRRVGSTEMTTRWLLAGSVIATTTKAATDPNMTIKSNLWKAPFAQYLRGVQAIIFNTMSIKCRARNTTFRLSIKSRSGTIKNAAQVLSNAFMYMTPLMALARMCPATTRLATLLNTRAGSKSDSGESLMKKYSSTRRRTADGGPSSVSFGFSRCCSRERQRSQNSILSIVPLSSESTLANFTSASSAKSFTFWSSLASVGDSSSVPSEAGPR